VTSLLLSAKKGSARSRCPTDRGELYAFGSMF